MNLSDQYIRPTRAIIDIQALQNNWELLRKKLAPSTGILAMIKANAYGHGAALMAQLCEDMGTAGLAVADMAEALELREEGYKKLLICIGPMTKEGVRHAIAHDVVLTAYSTDSIRLLSEETQKLRKPIRIHLEMNTGMNRLGISEDDWTRSADLIQANPHLRVEGVFTHLADSDNSDTAFALEQITQFQRAIKLFEETLKKRLVRHAANSGGILFHPEAHFDWVRPGIALYGYPPLSSNLNDGGFRPILSWRAPIVQIRNIAPGQTVSYNRTFKADRPMRIATVAVGYGDGFRRGFAPVGIGYRGKRRAIVGIICMDLLMFDVTDISDSEVGDEIHLIGPPETGAADAYELAQAVQTIPYEILTGIAARVARVTQKAAGASEIS